MRYLYAIYAVLAIAVLGLNLGGGAVRVLVIVAWMLLWIAAALIVFRAARHRWIALVPLIPLVGLLLFKFALGVVFVFQHQGLDCAVCDGSPAAFVLARGVEVALLVPGVVLLVWLFHWLRRNQA